MIRLAPSLLAADFACLGDEIAAVERAGAEYLHIDVMDGIFVPNISVGIPVIESIRKRSTLIFDVHLMIREPERYIEDFVQAGADSITVHLEAVCNLRKALAHIKALSKRAAVSVKPGTPVEALFDDLDMADMVLIMSVEPGFGGQEFMPGALQRAACLRSFIDANDLSADIEMDGGITLQNVDSVLESGVNIVVAGSSVFGQPDSMAAVRDFYSAFARAKT